MRRRNKDEVEGSRGFEGDTHVITFHVYATVHVTFAGDTRVGQGQQVK